MKAAPGKDVNGCKIGYKYFEKKDALHKVN